MSTTYVDTDLLEQMRDRMFQILSRVEESAGTLRQVHSQMMGEDLGLSFYPQWEQAVDSCSAALQKTERLCGAAGRFLTVLESAPEEYRMMERQHEQAIARMSERMSTLGAGMAGVMSADYPLGLSEGEETSNAMELERQTAAGVQSLEMANLMAVTQVLKEGVGYDEVMPGISGTAPEEDEEKPTESKADVPKGNAESPDENDKNRKKDGEQP